VEKGPDPDPVQLTYILPWQDAASLEDVMAYNSKLPSRFPVGTKFVIESRRGGAEGQGPVYSRHLEFPDGTCFPLPARPMPAQLKPKTPIARRTRRRRRKH
jgi:hypothetical protein